MKIILEFNDQDEHDFYCATHISRQKSETEQLQTPGKTETTIPFYTRRKHMSDMEIAFVKENYQHKKIPWIAKAINRKPEQIYNLLWQMYKKGLPRKTSKHGIINQN